MLRGGFPADIYVWNKLMLRHLLPSVEKTDAMAGRDNVSRIFKEQQTKVGV